MLANGDIFKLTLIKYSGVTRSQDTSFICLICNESWRNYHRPGALIFRCRKWNSIITRLNQIEQQI